MRLESPRRPGPEPREPDRDVAADLLRGLAMVVLLVNHIHLQSALEYVTASLMSAAEVLVLVSGAVGGMVYGRRWRRDGGRATTFGLLRRARRLYVTSVVVGALVGVLALVPGVAVDAVTAPGARSPAPDVGSVAGVLESALATVTLAVGPWQFCIVGFFAAAIAAAPAVLWLLHRGWWPVALGASLAVYAAGRTWPVDVLPMQSERPFPFLTWQLLFVAGLVLGHHRARAGRAFRAAPRAIGAAVVVAALVGLYLQFRVDGRDVLGLDPLVGLDPAEWARWTAAHYDKPSLDPARMGAMAAIAAGLYLLFRRYAGASRRAAAWLLLPLGRNSFYVFTVHVFLCLALASVPALAGSGPGLAANTLVQVACLAVLWAMVRHRVLFRWIPR